MISGSVPARRLDGAVGGGAGYAVVVQLDE